MACFCTDKKKLDYDYVRKLANAYSVTNTIDVQIYYTFGFDGKTKYYDYEETVGGRKLQVVETIRFEQPKSSDILPIAEQSGIDAISDEAVEAVANSTGAKKPIKRKVGGSVNKD